jgi:predicted PurR-regulated permease PerM
MADLAGEPLEEAVAAIRDATPAATKPLATEDMPLPTEPRTIFLGGLFLLALLAALYVASPIVLPVVLAIVLKLLLQPLVRLSDRLGVPHGLSALLAILLLALSLAALASGVAGPAASWAGKLPEAIPQIQQLAFWGARASSFNGCSGNWENFTGGGTVVSTERRLITPSISWAPCSQAYRDGVATRDFTTLIVLFTWWYLARPSCAASSKSCPLRRKASGGAISLQIERNISVYLITVTLINGVVGLLTSCIMWACGVANPPLWGVIAFVLNFVPILGPMVGIVILVMASVLSLGVTWWALLPVGLYFLVHVVEGEIATPMLMARRFTINPVAVILALIFWYWMWGVPGAVLAVPMLAITKIVCDELRPLRAFGHFLEA